MKHQPPLKLTATNTHFHHNFFFHLRGPTWLRFTATDLLRRWHSSEQRPGHFSGDSWMYPYQRTLSLYKPSIVDIYGYNPQESLGEHNKYHGHTVKGTPNCPLNFTASLWPFYFGRIGPQDGRIRGDTNLGDRFLSTIPGVVGPPS